MYDLKGIGFWLVLVFVLLVWLNFEFSKLNSVVWALLLIAVGFELRGLVGRFLLFFINVFCLIWCVNFFACLGIVWWVRGLKFWCFDFAEMCEFLGTGILVLIVQAESFLSFGELRFGFLFPKNESRARALGHGLLLFVVRDHSLTWWSCALLFLKCVILRALEVGLLCSFC